MRLLIADDEDYTREGLIESIPWSDYGVTEILQAVDGKEALDLSMRFKPDIVLTDIKMPKLNGIEFAGQLVKHCPDSKLLFMSGYMEIGFLKSAIQLSAVDFIEKPINLKTVEDAVKKAVSFINEKKKQNVNNIEKKELQMQNLANMLRYKNKDREVICHICKELDYEVQDNYIAIVIWDKEKTASKDQNIININNFWKINKYKSICTYIENDMYFVIINFQKGKEKNVAFLCEKLMEKSNNYYIGLGYAVKNLLEVSESYDTAMVNINQSFYDSTKHLFAAYGEKNRTKILDPNFYVEFNSIMNSNPKKLYEWMEQFFQKLCENKYYKKDHLQTLFASFAKTMLQNKKILVTKLENLYSEEDAEFYIMNSTSIYQIKDFIMNLVKKYQCEIENDFNYSKVVRGIMEYIDCHCAEADLEVGNIANYMHFSAAHLSVLFKQETGVTIKQYISDYRLELSKKLLANENYKINEIAELCGYSNANYFAKVFKASTNLSPVEYRKKFENI